MCKLHRGKQPSENDFTTNFWRRSHCSFSQVRSLFMGAMNLGTDVCLFLVCASASKIGHFVLLITYSVSSSVDRNVHGLALSS